MAPPPSQQRRTHNTLLFQRLLNLRDGASPFTLVLDTLEESGASLIGEFARRAKIGKSKIIYISFSTLRKRVPFEIDGFVFGRAKSLSILQQEIISHIASSPGNPQAAAQKYLLIIDTLNTLASSKPQHLSTFLSTLLLSPNISLLATHHTDIPLSHLPATQSYHPDPLTILIYLATAILTIHNLSQVVAKKRARDKSLQEPHFGLDERREGILIGLSGTLGAEGRAEVVVEMEIRRKSGRGILEVFVLAPPPPNSSIASKPTLDNVTLLDDHPLYSTLPPLNVLMGDGGGEGEEVETTFSLGLSEKERRAREGIVLPYFDAQRDGGASGAGMGGRILYEMGAEDREDFDDEEDEI
ncbi:Elongator complex protein 5 [Calycina marina]|uniref:Elongator complex protein 5 n=1 Tax=Calycina marina TaxID=1763456 RepID=A0A9P8CFV5_9HELO|nr:Elongator complex protein 5 [Calycina marina]